MVPVIAEHVEIVPGTCGGKPKIRGRRIRVQDIVTWYERLGLSPEEIVSEYPGLTLADVHAALAYYFDHREEIRADIKASEAFVAELKAGTPSKLAEKLLRRDNGGPPLPP